MYFPQIRVCWLKYASTRSGTQAKSLLWRQINRVFVGKWSLIMYLDPPLKTDGKILSVLLHSRHVLLTWQTIGIQYFYVCVCEGCLRVVMKSGWCGRHLQSLRHLTPNRRLKRGWHPWSQTLLNQEPVERWRTVWSPCWGELITINWCCYHTQQTGHTALESYFIKVSITLWCSCLQDNAALLLSSCFSDPKGRR